MNNNYEKRSENPIDKELFEFYLANLDLIQEYLRRYVICLGDKGFVVAKPTRYSAYEVVPVTVMLKRLTKSKKIFSVEGRWNKGGGHIYRGNFTESSVNKTYFFDEACAIAECERLNARRGVK